MGIERYWYKLRYDLLGDMPRERPYVFGVGLSKTATTSLSDALEILGYSPIHNPPVTRVTPDGQITLDWPWWLAKYDSATDLSVAVLYRELDAAFPNARFIHTTRELDRWLSSCQRHFTPELAATRREQKLGWTHELTRAFYGSEIFDEGSYREAFLRHEKDVQAYFDGRDDFLSLDLTRAPAWAEICTFLDHPVPERDFPFSNRGHAAPPPG